MSPAELTVLPGGHDRALGERDDDQLMLLASRGQQAAFGVLVARYAQRLRNYCAKMVDSVPLAEELAQETWLAVWNARARYVANGRFKVFLYVAARNRCYNLSRDQKKRAAQAASTGAIDEVVDARADHLDALVAEEQSRRVQAAIQRLPAKYRDALILRYAEELEYADIAQIVGRSEAGVRTRVHVGLQHLKKVLDQGCNP